jgi:hypothetical protein
MVDLPDWSAWGFLGVAGALGLCCVGTVTIAGGAAVAGGTVAATNAVSGGANGLGGALISGLATALPLFVIGLVLRRRLRD